MFGYAGYAQAPFATLGNPLYSMSIIEALSAADSSTTSASFASLITEALTPADSAVCGLAFSTAILESLTVQDIEQAIRQTNAISVENISITDILLAAAWVKINNTESTNWELIDNRQ